MDSQPGADGGYSPNVILEKIPLGGENGAGRPDFALFLASSRDRSRGKAKLGRVVPVSIKQFNKTMGLQAWALVSGGVY